MNEALLAFLYAILLVFACFLIILFYKKNGIKAKLLLLLVFSFYYLFMPFLIVSFKNILVVESSYLSYIFKVGSQALYRCYFVTFVVFIVLFSTCFYLERKSFLRRKRLKTNIASFESLRVLGVLFLIVGGGAFLLLCRELGGIQSAIANAAMIRAYSVSVETYLSPLGSALKTISFLVQGTIYCFLSTYLASKKKSDLFFLIISSIVVVLFILFSASRSSLVFLVLSIVCSLIKFKKKSPVLFLTITFIFVVLFSEVIGYFMDNILNLSASSFQSKSAFENMLSSINDFSYPYCNCLYVDREISLYGYRYFADYFSWIPSLLPSRLLQSIGIDVSSLNLITNENSSFFISMGSRGGTPVDFISFGMRQMPLFGLLISVVVIVFICNKVDLFDDSSHRAFSPLVWCMYLFIFNLIINYDFGAMTKVNIYNFIFFFAIIFYGRRKKYEGINCRERRFYLDKKIL